MSHRDYGDDDEKPDPKAGMHFEFECPDCNAHNPYHDGFKAGAEVVCFYCGMTYLVVEGDGRLRFKAV